MTDEPEFSPVKKCLACEDEAYITINGFCRMCLEADDLYTDEGKMWGCEMCPQSKEVTNRKLECGFDDCLRNWMECEVHRTTKRLDE